MKNKTAIVLPLVAAFLFISGCASVSSVSNDWVNTLFHDNTKAYEVFLQKHPNSQYANKAKAKISAFSKDAWEKACREDKIHFYESFIETYPNSEFLEKAKERVNWQRANRAVVEIDYPTMVNAGPSPYANISGPIYKWDTVFKETRGVVGFTLKATNFYIRDSHGGRWSNNWSEEVSVKPNEKATVDYWCQKYDKTAGGCYHATWVGEDDWGNQISIEQVVHFDHAFCFPAN